MDPYFTLHTKVNSKWIKDSIIHVEFKLPGSKHKGQTSESGLGNNFLDMTSKVQLTTTKKKTIKWVCIILQIFTARKAINRVERQHAVWGDISKPFT